MPGISYTEMTDAEIMKVIGRRLRALRGTMPQSVMAERSSLTRQTVSRAEQGDNPTLLTIVRLLRTAGRLDALDSFIPEPVVSPLALLREQEKRGKRGRTNG